MNRFIAIFLLFLCASGYSQNRSHITRNRKPLTSIGSIKIGSDIESVDVNLENFVPVESEFVEIYRIDNYPFTKNIILSNLYLKFYKRKLVEIILDFNQQYSDYIGYLQRTEYSDRPNGEIVITYNTFTPGIIFRSFLNGDRKDSMIMCIENYQE